MKWSGDREIVREGVGRGGQGGRERWRWSRTEEVVRGGSEGRPEWIPETAG